MVHRQRLNRIWRCRMALGVARWALALPDGPWRCRMSGALPDVRGVAGCPPVSPCGVAVCTVALPGGRGVAGWRGALPDNSPTRIPKLNLESEIRVLGLQRNMPVQASRRFDFLNGRSRDRFGQKCKFGHVVTTTNFGMLRVAFSQT